MSIKDVESLVKQCYSTWGGTYYEDYYRSGTAYPPVHVPLIKGLLLEDGIGSLLDAGCGPASFLRSFDGDGVSLYGFDLTPEMVVEARRILSGLRAPSWSAWEGSVLDPASFKVPGGGPERFDAAVCVGVFPHIREEDELIALGNLREAVKPGGKVVVEARNQLFSLFTLNRYSYDFLLNELVGLDSLEAQMGDKARELRSALEMLKGQFRMELPPMRGGKAHEPGYDQVLSRLHNPMTFTQKFASVGFTDVRLHFYHFHCLPPMFESLFPAEYRKLSLAMECPDDWRGHFMASAFVVSGRRA